MADSSPAQTGHYEYRQLIEFVRSAHSDGSTEKKQPAVVASSIISGDEARSFYEDLCADGDSCKQTRSDAFRSKTRHSKRKSDSHHEKRPLKRSSLAEDSRTSGIDNSEERFCETSKSADSSTSNSHTSVGEKCCFRNQIQKKSTSQRVEDHRRSALLRQAQNGNTEDVKALLEKGIDVNGMDQFGWTAIMSAAFEGHVDVVQTLLNSGADLNIKNSQGHTALSLAHKKHRTSVVQVIESFQRVGFVALESEANERQMVRFYCNVCKSEFAESDQDTHKRSTIHIFNMGKKPKDDSFLIPPSNVGFRLMMKTGWDGSRGLGPCGNGQRFPIKTLLKQDCKGLGNAVKDKAKVTHFKANDKSAVTRVQNKGHQRVADVRTLSRRARKAKERKEKQWEISIRHQLS